MKGWVPIVIVVLMAAAAGEAAIRKDWRYAFFWLLDFGITGWSAFVLK